MNKRINLVRAVGSEFAVRKLRPFILVALIFTAVILVALIWLVNLSVWWWLIVIPVFILIAAGLFIFLLARRILYKLRPAMSEEQKKAVLNFVDKFERVIDNFQTPMFLIVFRVVRDVIFSRESSLVRMVTKDGTTLHKDFIELARLF